MTTCLIYMLTPSAKDRSQTILNDSFSDPIFVPRHGTLSKHQENKEKPSRLMKDQLLVFEEKEKVNLFMKINQVSLKVACSTKTKKLFVFRPINLGLF